MNATLDAPPSHPVAAPKKKRWLTGNFLVISIIVHLLLGLGAAYFVVQQIYGKRKVTFQGGPPNQNPSQRALEHKVSMAKKQSVMSAPVQSKRIAVAGLAKISLPELPTLPTSADVSPTKMAGLGGQGVGLGVGASGGMGGGLGAGGGGGAVSLFGFRGNGQGMVGTFYDFKRDESGKNSGLHYGDRKYNEILKEFAKGGTWDPPGKFPHFTSKAKLSTKAFFYPAIKDTEAGAAFQSPETGPGQWIAHYTGSIVPTVSGSYRLVGWGDNVMVVGVNGHLVLDASDNGYVKPQRSKAVGSVAFPKKKDTPLFEGEWFQLTTGQAIKLDVLIGDEGGIFCAGLMIQKQGENYGSGKGNIPDLPLLIVGTLTHNEKKLYDEFLNDKAFKGPVFNTKPSGPSTGLTGSSLDR